MKNYEKIYCGPGPEDIDIESNASRHRLIISCTTRKVRKGIDGGIWYYNFDGSNKAIKFSLQDYNEKNIRPHGISVLNQKDESYLYVISHEDCDKILKFLIQDDKLYFIKKWSGKAYTFNAINDLFVTENEYIYVTDPGEFSLKKKKGRVYLFKPDEQDYKIIIEDVYYPNGILLNDNKLYLTASRENALYEYIVEGDGSVDLTSKTKLATLTSGDNITLDKDKLIIAIHPNKTRFFLHAVFRFRSPSAVYAYDLNSKKLDRIFWDKGKIISGSSTAIKIDNDLYVSQIFKDFILKVDLLKFG